MRLFFATFFVVLMMATSSFAVVKSEKIQSFRDWTAYTFQEGAATVCYIASQPIREEGNYTRRDDAFAFVTHRPALDERNVVNFLAGYTYKKESSVDVDVDGKKFELFTQGDRAWSPDVQTDEALIVAMKKGKKMIVKGTSARGTLTTDTYSLIGFTKAKQAIDRKCRAR